MSPRACWGLVAGAAGAVALLSFRAGRLAARAEWRAEQESGEQKRAVPHAAQRGGEALTRYAEDWEQAVPPSDS